MRSGTPRNVTPRPRSRSLLSRPPNSDPHLLLPPRPHSPANLPPLSLTRSHYPARSLTLLKTPRRSPRRKQRWFHSLLPQRILPLSWWRCCSLSSPPAQQPVPLCLHSPRHP